MSLTKIHFNKIAEIIKNHTNTFCVCDDEINNLFRGLVNDLSNYFKTQNPLFDENKFKEACLK